MVHNRVEIKKNTRPAPRLVTCRFWKEVQWLEDHPRHATSLLLMTNPYWASNFDAFEQFGDALTQALQSATESKVEGLGFEGQIFSSAFFSWATAECHAQGGTLRVVDLLLGRGEGASVVRLVVTMPGGRSALDALLALFAPLVHGACSPSQMCSDVSQTYNPVRASEKRSLLVSLAAVGVILLGAAICLGAAAICLSGAIRLVRTSTSLELVLFPPIKRAPNFRSYRIVKFPGNFPKSL